ncbi:MAG: NifU N-terminal domain-containing protein [Actinomycetota bacterium]|nr:NifU N-terminal domain-containing protein [Actinomycetota bacterium]
MGQLITVSRKPSVRSDVAIFELNRSLTGMGHERYKSAADAVRDRPVDELARRLFEAGGVEGVHVYSNMVTVDLAAGADASGLEQIIRDLFTYYRPGVEVVEPTA